MLKFTLKKILGIIPTLLVIIFLCFFVMRMAPGSPFDSEKPIDPQVKARLMEKYHLDKPFYIQAFYYITNALRGDLGPSLKKKDLTVSQYIKLGFPKSLTLGVISLIISLSIGIPIGILAAIYKNTYVDYIITSIAILGISIPLFVIGPILQYFLQLNGVCFIPLDGLQKEEDFQI